MTWNAVAVLLLLFASVPSLAAQINLRQPLAVDEHTVHLFHLDDLADGRVEDAAGGSRGRAPDAVPAIGRFGGALSCDGTGGWIDVSGLADEAPEDGMTVECWVKFRDRAGGDIICRNSGYMIRAGGTVQAYFSIDGSWRPVSGASSVPVGRWTHLAITYERATREVRIYIDGALDVARVPDGLTDGLLDAGSPVLRFGANTWRPSAMNAKLDEVRVSSVARSYRPLYADEPAPIARNTNLLANPSFESGMHGWRILREGNAHHLWAIESGDAAHGRAFLRATDPGARTLVSYPFRVPRGEAVTVSAAMRAERPTNGLVRLRCTAGRGAAPAEWFSVPKTWRRVSAPLRIPDDWPAETAYLEVGASEDALIDIDAVSVVVGQKPGFTQTAAQSIGLDAELPPQRTCMLNDGGALPVTVTNAGERARDLSIRCSVTDWLDREVSRQEVHVGRVAQGGIARAAFVLPDDRVGWFVAHLSAVQDGQAIKETNRIFNVIEPLQGVGDVAGSPLGMNTHMEREPTEHLDDNLRMLALCGVKWIRGWWGWGMAEKEPGRFDWTEYDRQLDAVHRAGMEIMPILLRYYPNYEHEWAGETDRIQRPPRDMDQWAAYVRTTAAHYRDEVTAWEVWNEPVYTLEAGYYARLLKSTYDSIRAADPSVAVVGFGGSGPDYIGEVFQAGSVDCMDVISVHSYSELTRPFERMAELNEAVEDLAGEFGAPPRVWHTEQGSQADGIGYRPSAQTEEQCAVNLVQGYLSALSSGAEKFFWFSAQTTPRYGWAVFYENYVPRPRLVALNGLARVLNGRRVTGRTTLGDGLVACVLMDGERGAAAALWNLDDPVTVRLPAGTAAHWADMLGNPSDAGAGEPVDLQRGRPVYLSAPGKGPAELTAALADADVSLRAPVAVGLSPTAEGRLKMTLRGESDRHADLRITLRAPDLFGAEPEPIGIADLGPDAVETRVLDLDKMPPAGAEIAVAVGIEFGTHAIRRTTVRKTVRF